MSIQLHTPSTREFDTDRAIKYAHGAYDAIRQPWSRTSTFGRIVQTAGAAALTGLAMIGAYNALQDDRDPMEGIPVAPSALDVPIEAGDRMVFDPSGNLVQGQGN